MSVDFVTAEIRNLGGAIARKLERLRADADASAGPGTPAYAPYAEFHRAWAAGGPDEHRQMLAEAEREEAAVREVV
jgi:hypothetical protein